jgi:hypothetical protein
MAASISACLVAMSFTPNFGPDEQAAFERFLAGGGSRTQAAAIVLGSEESHSYQVQRDYGFLGREPDAAGKTAFLRLLDSGATEGMVQAVLLASDEFLARVAG